MYRQLVALGLLCCAIALPASGASLAGAEQVFVRRVELRGNTVFGAAELAELTAPYQNRVVSTDQLQELRLALTRYYVDRGYVNSGAVLPDQDVADGVVVFDIVEGHLAELRLRGNERLRDGYIEAILDPTPGAVLHLPELQDRLQRLQQDPLIERIDASLTPGERPGEALLSAAVDEAPAYRFGLTLANDRPPGVGGEQARLIVGHGNLSGWGDSLMLHYGVSHGADDYSLAYRLPLRGGREELEFAAEHSESAVLEAPFDRLNIDSELDAARIGLRHYRRQTSQQQLAFGVSLEHRRNATTLLGRRFSFSAGAQDGISRVTALRFSQHWLNRGIDQVLALRSTFSIGIDAFNATRNAAGPDGRFVAWLGQLQWARRFAEQGQLVLRADLQLTDSPLLSLEKFPLGGSASVRGYRESLLLRDNAVVASLEYRYPLARLPLAGVSRGPDDGRLQLAAFVDWGRGWNKNIPSPDPGDIAGTGLGLLWQAGPRLQARLYWAEALRKVATAERDLQDDGVHFRLEWRYP